MVIFHSYVKLLLIPRLPGESHNARVQLLLLLLLLHLLCQLRMQRAMPGPELHIASGPNLPNCQPRRVWSTPGPELMPERMQRKKAR